MSLKKQIIVSLIVGALLLYGVLVLQGTRDSLLYDSLVVGGLYYGFPMSIHTTAIAYDTSYRWEFVQFVDWLFWSAIAFAILRGIERMRKKNV